LICASPADAQFSPTSGTDRKIFYPQREDVNPVPRPDWVLTRRREIGHHIAALRAARGLSVDDLADASGLDRKSVMRAERALISTGLDVLLQLAAGLEVPLPELVDAPKPQ
jgi:ribosome-binding protein aMBF1 (putative translation factor)